jgi:predicted membrane chloride channel (bestrophin family)
MITWALDEVKYQIDNDEVHTLKEDKIVSSMNWRAIQSCAFDIRGHMSQIINGLKQPVPWPYFHLLNLMVLVTLSLVAYGLVGYGNPILTFFIHCIICTIFIGMKNLAVAMSDPFGDDAIDFNLEGFLKGSYKNVVAHFQEKHEVFGNKCPEGMTIPIVHEGDLAKSPKSQKGDTGCRGARATERTNLLAGCAD